MKKIIIISIIVFLSGCSLIKSTRHEFSDEHIVALVKIEGAIDTCDRLQSDINLNRNIDYEHLMNTYNQYLTYKQDAIDNDPNIVSYKYSILYKCINYSCFIFPPKISNIHEKICECEKVVKPFIEKKKAEIEVEKKRQE